MIDGRFISGAGGGGFLQVILKRGVTKEALRERLKQVFEDSVQMFGRRNLSGNKMQNERKEK